MNTGPMLELDGVGFAYPGGRGVLRDVTFTVASGEKVAVLGANGAGKTTLLLHVNGLLMPTAGRVRVAGVEVKDATLREVRRRVGLVFQDPDDQLFLPTLLEDVAFGPLNEGMPPGEAEGMARRCLAELGLETAAGRAAHHLSGGEKRLAALATVLVSTPELLVLDEPTAALGARARRRVVDRLRATPGTLLAATHDLGVAAALCRRAVVLVAGRVAVDMPVHDLLHDDVLLRDCGLTDPLEGLPEPASRLSPAGS